MKTTEGSVNPAMITLAREAGALTQSELAARVGVSQAQFSKFEAGLLMPSESQVSLLAEVLGYPVAFFEQKQQVYGPGVSEFFHRSRQDVPIKLLKQAHAKVGIFLMQIAALLKHVEIGECRIPRLDPEDKGVEEVARAIRALWQLPAGPVQSVVEAIENAGGVVVKCSFGTPRIDAISRWVPGLPPIFFVNDSLPVDRERLTLCHELGHMVMHQRPDRDMEDEANRFAAAFLMPAKDVRPYLDGISIEKLAALKPYWKVSMAALLYRTRELSKVSENAYRFLWMRMGKAGYRRREPPELDLPREEPRLLREIFGVYRSHLSFSAGDLARLLATREERLAREYGLELSPAEGRGLIRLIRKA